MKLRHSLMGSSLNFLYGLGGGYPMAWENSRKFPELKRECALPTILSKLAPVVNQGCPRAGSNLAGQVVTVTGPGP